MMSSRQRAEIQPTQLAFYLTLISISSLGILAADWADHLVLVVLIAWIGALVGTLLARSIFGAALATPIATVYGLFLLGWQFSLTMDPVLLPRERLFALFGRLGAFLQVIGRAEDNPDPLMVVMIIAGLYWIISCFGAWSLFRRRDLWLASVPPGVALLINRFYYFGRARLDLMLALYVLITILFLLQQELGNRQGVWSRLRAQVAANAVGHVARTGAIVAVVLVSLSWVGPAFARSELAADIWFSVSTPWRRARDRLGNAVASLRSTTWFVRDFGDSLQLDEGVLPPDEVVMEVDPGAQVPGSGRFYWRARTYEYYKDGRWRDRQGELIDFDPTAGELELVTGDGRQPVEFTFRLRRPQDRFLYLPAQPLWVNRSSDVRVQRWQGELVDVAAFTVPQTIYAGESYRARGSIANPTYEQLQAASDEYPQWVRDQYLQVPGEVTERTVQTALRVTQDLETAYEKAAAITAWLRQNIEYQRVTDPPPSGREPLDWFLFEYGQGYCNYYASAEVIMLRAMGVPARLATGYAQGAYDAEGGVYVVNSRDYHAWPEVFFPGYGWVEFEPTVSQAPLVREAQDRAANTETEEAAESGEADEFALIRRLRNRYLRRGDDQLVPRGSNLPAPLSSFPFRRLTPLAAALVATGLWLWTRLDAGWRLTLAGLANWIVRAVGPERAPARLANLARHASVAHRAYGRWLSWWPRLGLIPAADQTPSERANLFAASYPSLGQAGAEIAAAYAAERFGDRMTDRQAVIAAWGRLSRGLWRAWLSHRWRAVLERIPLIHPSGA